MMTSRPAPPLQLRMVHGTLLLCFAFFLLNISLSNSAPFVPVLWSANPHYCHEQIDNGRWHSGPRRILNRLWRCEEGRSRVVQIAERILYCTDEILRSNHHAKGPAIVSRVRRWHQVRLSHWWLCLAASLALLFRRIGALLLVHDSQVRISAPLMPMVWVSMTTT